MASPGFGEREQVCCPFRALALKEHVKPHRHNLGSTVCQADRCPISLHVKFLGPHSCKEKPGSGRVATAVVEWAAVRLMSQ